MYVGEINKRVNKELVKINGNDCHYNPALIFE